MLRDVTAIDRTRPGLERAAFVWPRRPAAGVFAVSFGLIYAPLASVRDWTQLAVMRALAGLSQTDPSAAEAAYRVFESPGGLVSFTYGFDVLARVSWGLAALSIAGGLLAFRDRLAQVTAGLFALGGMLALAGGIGFVARVPALEVGVLASGVSSLSALLLSALLLRRAQNASA